MILIILYDSLETWLDSWEFGLFAWKVITIISYEWYDSPCNVSTRRIFYIYNSSRQLNLVLLKETKMIDWWESYTVEEAAFHKNIDKYDWNQGEVAYAMQIRVHFCIWQLLCLSKFISNIAKLMLHGLLGWYSITLYDRVMYSIILTFSILIPLETQDLRIYIGESSFPAFFLWQNLQLCL